MVVEPKATVAGVTPILSFAVFKTSGVAFSEERALFRPPCCRDVVAMAETPGSCVQAVRKNQNHSKYYSSRRERFVITGLVSYEARRGSFFT